MDDGQAIPPHTLPFLLSSSTKNNLQDISIPPHRQPRQPSRSPSARNNTSSKARLLLATLAAFLALDGVQAADVTATTTTTTTAGEVGQIAGGRSLEPEGTPAPEVPDFLCPAIALVAPLPRPVPPTRTASEASHSQAERQGRHRRRDRKSRDTATATALENSHRLYLARSTFSTASSSSNFRSPSLSSSLFSSYNTLATAHNDRRPLPEEQLILDNDAKSQGRRTETEDVRRRHSTASDYNNNVGNTKSKFSALRQKPKRKRKRRSRTSIKEFNNNLNSRSTDVDEVDTSTHGCFELFTSRTIPDRYELGNDGRWHKLSVSSSCTPCQCESHDIDDAADADLSSTGVVNADTSYEAEDPYISGFPPSTPSTELDSRIVLPDGWDRSFDSVVYQVPLIVIASLLVAASVVGSVWFVFFWRRRQRTARRLSRERDLEKRRRVRENESDESGHESDGGDDDVGRERRGRLPVGEVDAYPDGRRRLRTSEEKVKARWARATEKWKAHVRWIHRRKRGRASIIDGTKPRDAAMASGVSLVRSVASGPPVSLTRITEGDVNNDSVSISAGRARRSGSRPRVGRRNNDIAERGESEGESSSSVSSSDGGEGVVTRGDGRSITSRGPGSRDRRRRSHSSASEEGPSRASRDSGPQPYLEGRRSVVFLPDQGQNRTQRNSRRNGQNLNDDEREADGIAYICQQCLTRSRLIRSRPTHGTDPNPANTTNTTASSDNQHQIATSSSSFISSTVSRDYIRGPWVPRGEYDRPPPELSPTELEAVSGRRLVGEEVDEDEVRQGPPAYRSRRSDDVVVGQGRHVSRRRRGRRRTGVHEKRASAAAAVVASGSGAQYLPAPEDFAPYSSSDDGEDAGSESETRSMTSSSSSIRRSRRRDQLNGTTMHVAVDDKQALARLATYASAPPPSSLSHSDSMFSRNSSSLLASNAPSSLPSDHTGSIRANAPPEPEEEWESFEVNGHAYECDSPGAGPGPSTVSARSRSSSRNCSASRPSSRPRSSVPPESLFPAPPTARPSKLAYAPADAGLSLPLVQPPDSEYGYGMHDFGLDLDSALDRVLSQGASAPPPFSASSSAIPTAPYPYDEVDLGIAPSAPHMGDEDGDVLIGASAPPLFMDDDGAPGGELVMNEGERPSAPPTEDDLYIDDVDVEVLQRDKGANENLASAPTVEEPQEPKGSQDHEEVTKPSSPPSPPSRLPPEVDHADSADRDAVLSAVR